MLGTHHIWNDLLTYIIFCSGYVPDSMQGYATHTHALTLSKMTQKDNNDNRKTLESEMSLQFPLHYVLPPPSEALNEVFNRWIHPLLSVIFPYSALLLFLKIGKPCGNGQHLVWRLPSFTVYAVSAHLNTKLTKCRATHFPY